MPASRTTSLLALALAASGCASLHHPACQDGSQSAIQDTLYFGTGGVDGAVTDEEWTGFLEVAVTPRFPQGFTVLQASGQWRASPGTIIYESTHVLQLVHPRDTASEKSIMGMIAAYKAQFRQEAVLRVTTGACVTF